VNLAGSFNCRQCPDDVVAGHGAISVNAVDIDKDGDIDVVGAAYMTGDVFWWENTNGIGSTWLKHSVDADFTGVYCVYVQDVDGDADADILGASTTTGNIVWWENADGIGGTWTLHSIEGDLTVAASVYATDVDGDGAIDVLGTCAFDDEVLWWKNEDGAGTVWSKHYVATSFEGAWSVYASDVDGDADTDVFAAAFFGDRIALWENQDGSGTNWAEHILDESFEGARAVHAADLTGDGYPEVIGAAESDDAISKWEVIGYATSGSLESSILDAGGVESWHTANLEFAQSPSTSVSFQFRSSQNALEMGAWSDTVSGMFINLSEFLDDSTRFLQYRAILQTNDQQSTSILNSVGVAYSSYTSTGDTEQAETQRFELAPLSNPSFGEVSVMITLVEAAAVNLQLHDIAGRTISSFSGELNKGSSSILFNDIPQGVVFCSIHSGDLVETVRVVVLP